MDPASLIITALTVGGTFIATQAASEAVKDAYRSLRDRIKARLADNPSASLALVEHETDPETWERPLRKALTESQVHEDEALVRLAQMIMAEADPAQAAVGRYNTQVSGSVQQLNVGEHQTVTANFGAPTPDPPGKRTQEN